MWSIASPIKHDQEIFLDIRAADNLIVAVLSLVSADRRFQGAERVGSLEPGHTHDIFRGLSLKSRCLKV